MKKTFVLSLILSLSLPPVAGAKTLVKAVRSHTSEVTAYSQQAMVTRQVNLGMIDPGHYEIKIVDMPIKLHPDSLSVKGSGQAQALIHHVEVLPLDEQPPDPKLVQLEAQLDALSHQRHTLESQLKVQGGRQEFLDTVKAVSTDKIRQQLAHYQVKIDDWQSLSQFIASEQGSILDKQFAAEFQLRKLAEQEKKLKAQLDALRQTMVPQKQAVVVYLSVEKAGTLNLDVSYLVNQVSWKPAYEARLDEKTEQLRLTFLGDLTQQTGEDWEQTRLHLSTATPFVDSSIPSLQPWYIQPENMAQYKNAPTSAMGRSQEEREDLGEAERQRREINYAQSQIETKGVSVLFSLPQAISIKSAQSSRRVAVATRYFKFQREYEIVPRRSSLAYFKVKFQNKAELPLLAGQIRTYVDSDYTGTGHLALVRPNEHTTVPFGVDHDLKVNFDEILSKTISTGVLNDMLRHHKQYRIEVTNFKQAAQKVNIYDHLPLSTNPQIRVQEVELTPTPSERLEQGLLKWQMEIKPGEKKTILLSYWVEHPQNLPIRF